jgi:heptosyltransferase-2
VERFAELGRRLEAEGTGPVAVCFGPGEDALREAWTWGWGDGPEWIAVAEPLDVTAAVVQRSRVVVCGDTGLMHMAAAVGTPVVAVFGPTVTRFGFRPAGVEHRVLETELSCRPCSVHGTSSCPQGHFRCMLEVTPAAVEAAVRAVAPARPAAR